MTIWRTALSALFSPILLLSWTRPADGGNVDVVFCADGASAIVGAVEGTFVMPEGSSSEGTSSAEILIDEGSDLYSIEGSGIQTSSAVVKGTITRGDHTLNGFYIVPSELMSTSGFVLGFYATSDDFEIFIGNDDTSPVAGESVTLSETFFASGSYADNLQDAITTVTFQTEPTPNTIRWITCAAAYDSATDSCMNPEEACSELFPTSTPTSSPTGAPTSLPTSDMGDPSASVVGDPHIARWHKDSFDFHGECDLVMVHSDKTVDDKPLDLHIRTTIEGSFSSITAMVLRVGDDLMEIDPYNFYIKGHKRKWDALPFATDSFHMTKAIKRVGGPFRHSFEIVIGDGDHKSTIHVRRSRANRSIDLLSISIDGSPLHFGESHGLLGNYVTGDALGRDGRKMDGDWNAYGMEWQVTADEPKLFREDREPQLPHAKCIMPVHEITSETVHALKVEFPDLFLEAQVACRMAGHVLNDCMEDVMLAKDVKAAGAYV